MRYKIIKALRLNSQISGQELADQLGISRAAVAKHINVLRKEGYQIEALSGQGYSLVYAPDILNADEVSSYLAANSYLNWQITYQEQVNSTNRQLKMQAVDGAPQGLVLVAESQMAGEGRLSRSWYSPALGGLWFSLLLRPTFGPQLAQTITLMMACAIADALNDLGFAAGIKWPNDILINGRKLCGIKSEICADIDNVSWLVSGIGLNINISEFPPDLADIATSLKMLSGQSYKRAEILAKLLAKIDYYYQILQEQGFEPIRQVWLKYALYLGEQIFISGINGKYPALAIDLAEDGQLIIDNNGQIEKIHGGDILLD